MLANGCNVNVIAINNSVIRDGLCALEDGIGYALWSRSTILNVVLDTKVGVRTTGVVTSSEENAASGLAQTNQVRGSRGRQNTVLTDDELCDTIACRETNDLLYCRLGIVAAVATDNKR